MYYPPITCRLLGCSGTVRSMHKNQQNSWFSHCSLPTSLDKQFLVFPLYLSSFLLLDLGGGGGGGG